MTEPNSTVPAEATNAPAANEPAQDSAPNDSAKTSGGVDASTLEAPAATAVLEDLDKLRVRAETAELERDQFRDLVKRTQADFENYQKRIQRDLQQERRYCHAALARDLLTALDNLDRAMEAAQKAGESGPLVQGVAMVRSQILDAFRRHGITPIEALGQPFDPNLHQAVMQRPDAEQPPNTVLQVLQQGFQIHDRVLRPAAVVVSTQG
ncbi:MAG: nucleotide exchange factor GrpE [Gemmataceae bacterium]|nr:nucleotide exchange factor GrpE [Gemmataceae bacterium]MDW8264345.1 nucleotide exchange factor GrpE [Gemmataceae bacterium]